MHPQSTVSQLGRTLFLALALATTMPLSHALTDIADKPIATSTTVDVKPNIMLLMDTSASMGFSHMPDEIEGVTASLPIGYKSYQCNSIYYNPNTTYGLPKDANGISLAAPSFNAARYNYYSTNVSVVDLGSAFQAYDNATRSNQATNANDTPQPAYYYVYTSGSETLKYNTLPCTQPDVGTSGQAVNISTAGGGQWTRKIVGSSSGVSPHVDERQNFAIWYTYYRTRMAMTKSSLGLAFAPLTSRFRVGFVTANPGKPVAADKYLAIADFTTSNKAAWYSKINSQVPGGSSPMREGLARVGRHYANKHDGINLGMDGDPVQYGCQKNFTLMTTDGYWNTAAETDGPVQLDGATLVGQQDGTYTGDSGYTPYGVWDGGNTSTRVTTNKFNTYTSDATCVGGYVYKRTEQQSETDRQTRKSTTQALQTTQQDLQSTGQVTMSTTQTLSEVSHIKKLTSRTDATVKEVRQSTVQNLESTVQWFLSTTTLTQTQTQLNRSTLQNLESTQQMSQSTFQTLQRQERIDQTTSQTFATDTQVLQSTTQTLQSTSRKTASTQQWMQSTARTDQTVTQVRQSTSQLNRYDGSTELSTPAASCTASGSISCYTVTSGPTLVASCTAATPNAGNNYTNTTCVTSTVSATAPVQTCSAAAASAGNNYQTTTCTPVNTGPTAVASCTNTTGSSGNSWTTISCGSNVTGPTPVASCSNGSSGAPNYITTSCNTIAPAATGVQTCAAISPNVGNNYTTTSCTPNNTVNVGVPSCSASSPSAGNAWVNTTCSSGNVASRPVASCAPQTAGSGNNWLGRTCVTNAPVVAVASCSTQTPNSGNSYVSIGCNTVTVSANAPVATCTAVPATSGNGYVSTICTPNNTGPVFVAPGTCSANAGTASPYNRVTCTPTVTTNVPVASCTADPGTTGPAYLVRTCPTPVTSGPTPVASCTTTPAAAPLWVATTCTTPVVSGPTVMACTVGTTTNGTGLTTTCSSVNVTNPVLANSCTLGTTTSGGVTTTCSKTVTTNVPVQTCSPVSGTAAPYLTRTCPTPVTTGPTLVDTCTASAGTAPSWITTSCTPSTISGPTAVPNCIAGLNGTNAGIHQTTTCTPVNGTTDPINPALCVVASPDGTNNYTTTTCPKVVNTASAGVQTCNSVTAVTPLWRTTTCTPNNTGPTLVASCSPVTASGSNQWQGTTCNPIPLTGPTAVASCSPVAASAANGWIATTCGTNNTTNVPVASCTASGKSSPNFVATTCSVSNTAATPVALGSCNGFTAGIAPNYIDATCTTTTTGPTLVASCTTTPPTSANGYTDVACSSNVVGPTLVPAASCAAAAPTGGAFGNAFTATTCTPVPGNKFQVSTTTSVLTQYLSGSKIITNPPAAPAVVTTTAPADVDGICYTPGVPPPMPALPTTQPALPTGCTAWPCVVNTDNVVGGSANSLADVAQYYYVHDLRPELADQTGIISNSPLDDHAPWQHMTTFALGLGVSGTLGFEANYLASTTGDFAKIRPPVAVPPALPQDPLLNWPAWPDPAVNYSDPRVYNDPKSIDDFWHAAVNGRGKYFSADNPAAVVDGLGAALALIDSLPGAGGQVSLSTNKPVANDKTVFVTSFQTGSWYGDVTAQYLDLDTGAILPIDSAAAGNWSASAKLDAVTAAACDNRTIYIRNAGNTNGLANFSWNTKACSNGVPTGSADTGLDSTQQALFGASAIANLSQYAVMTDGSNGTANQRSAAAGANLVNFIRGQRGLEVPIDAFVPNNASTLYRKRTHVLGDVVGSVAAYVGVPKQAYADLGYDTFKAAQASRTPMLYVGANDGMLHAFYAPDSASDPYISSAGSEAWAYIPKVVMPELYRLADTDYKANHRFFVDGSPTTGDVYDSTASAWKTILVGGLKAGGKGFYALDVTNPTSPKSLWEFNQGAACYNPVSGTSAGVDCHIGLSFGRPIITKLVNGTWVVLLTSGYNNVQTPEGAGDGHGYLYVLNAMTGQIISKIDTGVGNGSLPSGLSEVNNYVANGSLDNTTLRVYGGDLLGNIWRFDVNDNLAPSGKEATLVATAKDAGGTPQPITTRLQLAEVDGKTLIVAATGQFLGGSDTSSTQVQSVYGFSDLLGSSVQFPDLRGSMRQISLTQSGTTRTTTCSGGTTNCAQTNGWVVDLPESGERINVDPVLLGGTLVFASNVPSNSACQAGGHSWINFVSLLSGLAVSSSPDGVASQYLKDALSVGLNYVALPSGLVKGIVRFSDGTVQYPTPPIDPPKPFGRRVSWREITR